MPEILVTDRTFGRLQALAQPLIDDANSVIEMLLDHSEMQMPFDVNRPTIAKIQGSARQFDGLDPPSLTHSKLRSAHVNGIELERPKWSDLVRHLLELAFEKTGRFDDLRRMTDAHVVEGIKTDEGFTPMERHGFSVQGVDVQDAWRISIGIARKLMVPILVTFEWRDKERAAFPGELGVMRWSPSEKLHSE